MPNHEIPIEFIDIEPIDDYISRCRIKVMYHGFNRNKGYISKPVAEEIANSLPRTPIVGKFIEEVDDFGGHEEELEITSEGVKFVRKTMPYGAVDEYSPIVWEKHEDEDGEIKEYLVANGYLWTGRYPELKKLINSPKGQSMEFFPESVEGFWAKPDNKDEEVFIYSEADISALCILGDDVEPCYEDADIEIPSVYYALDEDKFKTEFNVFMKELNKALVEEKKDEGGSNLKKYNHALEDAEAAVKKAEESKKQEDVDAAKELVKELEDGEEKTELEERLKAIEVEKDDSKDDDKKDDDKDKPKTDNDIDSSAEFAALQEEIANLKEALETLKTDHSILVEEKKEREAAEKDALYEQFSALGEEVINKFKTDFEHYSPEELEKELSAIAFKKGLSFNLLAGKEDVVTILPGEGRANEPAWIKAIQNKENR